MNKQPTDTKPFVSSEVEKRVSARPRLGLRFSTALETNGGLGAKG